MGSQLQTRWARSHTAPHVERDAAGGTPRRGSVASRDPRTIGLLLIGCWLLPVLTDLVGADALLIAAVVYLTGGLIRYGGTVLDRLMITLGLLSGTAMAAGILFSLWPFGLDPVAVGGTALSVLLGVGAATRRKPLWPRRVLGSDLVLLGALAAGTAIAYGPARRPGRELGFAALTGDRLRHFSLFDTIHRIGGYPFLLQNRARPVVDPGMLSVYPPGQHFVYALFDVFATSSTDPGDPVRELTRYHVYTCVGYGFFVLCVAWAARWVAGPALAGWRRTFLVSAIAAFLCAGVLTTAIWCNWDPQIFAMGLLALLAGCALRPPASGRFMILLFASFSVAMVLAYELFAPFAAVIITVSAVVYRRRWLAHWRFALGTAAVTAPVAFSEFFAAQQAGLQSGQAALIAGFTVPMTKQSLAVIGVVAVAGFAVARARHRPSAVAAFLSVVVCGAAVAAYHAYQHANIGTTTYYYEKAVQAWVVIALVGTGTAGHLLRRPKLPTRGVAGAVLGCCALLGGIVATDSFSYGRLHFSYAEMRTGRHTTWERMWVSGRSVYPTDWKTLNTLRNMHLLGDGVPSMVIWDDSPLGNTNTTLTLATLNHDSGTVASAVYGLGGSAALASVGPWGTWSSQQLASLDAVEKSLAASPVPLRVIVGNPDLAQRLDLFSTEHPASKVNVLLVPKLPGEASP